MARSLAAAFVLLVATLAPPAQADVVGRASVIDGDTIEIHGQRIRLFGIDAPESAQTCIAEDEWPCGRRAAHALDEKIGGRPVTCIEKDRDRYRRIVAVCSAGNEDLNAWLVAAGWALAYRKYSTAYVAEEKAARAAHRGVWRGSILAPWDWRVARQAEAAAKKRAGSGHASEPAANETRDCRIKGNVSSKGERIYHVPGGAFYDRTVINTAKGERWFCSESEAQAAGWRRSLR